MRTLAVLYHENDMIEFVSLLEFLEIEEICHGLIDALLLGSDITVWIRRYYEFLYKYRNHRSHINGG